MLTLHFLQQPWVASNLLLVSQARLSRSSVYECQVCLIHYSVKLLSHESYMYMKARSTSEVEFKFACKIGCACIPQECDCTLHVQREAVGRLTVFGA